MSVDFLYFIIFLLVCLLVYSLRKIFNLGRPEYRRSEILTENEKDFFARLAAASDANNWKVFVQVSMAALIQPEASKKSKKWVDSFKAIASKRVDFVVCDNDFNVLAVVELDDASHRAKRSDDRERDRRLATAGIKTIRYETMNKPLAKEIAFDVLNAIKNQ